MGEPRSSCGCLYPQPCTCRPPLALVRPHLPPGLRLRLVSTNRLGRTTWQATDLQHLERTARVVEDQIPGMWWAWRDQHPWPATPRRPDTGPWPTVLEAALAALGREPQQ